MTAVPDVVSALLEARDAAAATPLDASNDGGAGKLRGCTAREQVGTRSWACGSKGGMQQQGAHMLRVKVQAWLLC